MKKDKFKITSIKPIVFSLLFGSIALKTGGNPFVLDTVPTFLVYESEDTIDDYKIGENNKYKIVETDNDYLPYDELEDKNYIEVKVEEPFYEDDNKYYRNVTTARYNNIGHGDAVKFYDSVLDGTFSLDMFDAQYKDTNVVEYDEVDDFMLDKTSLSWKYSNYSIFDRVNRKQNTKEQAIDILSLVALLYFGYSFGKELSNTKKEYIKIKSIFPITGAILLGSFVINRATPFIPDDVELFNVYENEYTISDYQDDKIYWRQDEEIDYVNHKPILLPYDEAIKKDYATIVFKKPVYEINDKYYQEVTTIKCNNLDDDARRVAIDDAITHGDFDFTMSMLSDYYDADVSTDTTKYKDEVIDKNSSVSVDVVYPYLGDVKGVRKQTFEEDFYDTMLFGAYLFFGHKLGEIVEGLFKKNKLLVKK